MPGGQREPGEPEYGRDQPGKQHFVRAWEPLVPPAVRPGGRGEPGLQVGLVHRGVFQGAREAGLALHIEERQEEGQRGPDRHHGAGGQGDPIARLPPEATAPRVPERAQPDEQRREDAVVGAQQGLHEEGQPQGRASTHRRSLDDAVEREQAQWQAPRHQQLHVSHAREHERAVGEGNAGRPSRRARPRQVGEQGVAAQKRQGEADQHHRVVRDQGVLRGPVEGDRQGPRGDVGLGVGERRRVGVEDVRVVEIAGIGDQGAGHPRHDPDAELAVAGVDAAHAIDAAGKRPRHHDRQDDGRQAERRGVDPAVHRRAW